MRTTLPFLLLLTACEDFWDAPVPTGTGDGLTDCQFDDMEEVPGASMTITNLRVNNISYNAAFRATSYDPEGYSACWNPDTEQMTWIFEQSGVPVGTLSAVLPETTGNLDMATTSPGFALTFFDSGASGYTGYGGGGSTFTNTHFTTGAWVVDSLAPFEHTITGQAQNQGEILEVTLSARGY